MSGPESFYTTLEAIEKNDPVEFETVPRIIRDFVSSSFVVMKCGFYTDEYWPSLDDAGNCVLHVAIKSLEVTWNLGSCEYGISKVCTLAEAVSEALGEQRLKPDAMLRIMREGPLVQNHKEFVDKLDRAGMSEILRQRLAYS